MGAARWGGGAGAGRRRLRDGVSGSRVKRGRLRVLVEVGVGVGVGGRWAGGRLEGGLVGVDGVVVGAGSRYWGEADGFWTAGECVSSVSNAGERGGREWDGARYRARVPFLPCGLAAVLLVMVR